MNKVNSGSQRISINKVFLSGFVKTPVKFPTDKMATFFVSTPSYKKDSNEKYSSSLHQIVVYNTYFIEQIKKNNLEKGDFVFLVGELRTSEWNSKDGQQMKSTQIVIGDYRGEFRILEKSSENPVKEMDHFEKLIDESEFGDESFSIDFDEKKF